MKLSGKRAAKREKDRVSGHGVDPAAYRMNINRVARRWIRTQGMEQAVERVKDHAINQFFEKWIFLVFKRRR